MFRCTDCGQEYEIKPDYCDCGNNVFEEVLPAAPKQEKSASAPDEPIVRPQPARKSVELYAVLIFISCIILSVLALIFIGKEGKKPVTAETTAVETQKLEIPSIDKLWKEPKVKAPEPVVVTPVVPVKQEVKAVVSQPKKSQPVVTKTPVKTTVTKTPVAQTPAPVVVPQSQPVTQNKPSMTEAQKQEIIKKLTKTNSPKTQAPTQTQVQQPQTTQPQVQTKPVEVVKQPEPPKIDYAAQKRELNAYKVALRNKIGANINFAAVIGDGKCAITFKLDETGNLINRAFSLQSTNDSLNDAVYAAMMQNPTFKAPPEGYKNETLTLSVKIYGGQFEVELK